MVDGRIRFCLYFLNEEKFCNRRVALKLMTPILLCWPMMSEADVGDVAVEVEPSCQYSVKFCCRATDGSRGAV